MYIRYVLWVETNEPNEVKKGRGEVITINRDDEYIKKPSQRK